MTGKKILIVDQDADALDMMCGTLERMGNAILRSRDADNALALFAANRPLELAIVAIHLQRMDGLDLGRTMGLNQPGLRILYVSGSISDAAVLLREKKLPPYGYFLHKPFLPKQLLEMIGVMLLAESGSLAKL